MIMFRKTRAVCYSNNIHKINVVHVGHTKKHAFDKPSSEKKHVLRRVRFVHRISV